MKLLKGKVLAEKIKPTEVNSSGLYIPESQQNKYDAKILETGPGVEFVNVGDTVRYFQGKGVPYPHQNKDCIFLRESEIEFVL